MDCKGPCLPHCSCNRLTLALAFAALVYIASAVVYLIAVRILNIGTPFKDTLSTSQRRTLADAKAVRGRVYLAALGVSAAAVFFSGARKLLLAPA